MRTAAGGRNRIRPPVHPIARRGYLNCRPTIHPDRDGWVAAGYTLQGGQSRQNILPRVVHYELT
jgi:hypothetical protein